MSSGGFLSIESWNYRDIAPSRPAPPQPETAGSAPPITRSGISEEEAGVRVRSALAEAEQRWAAEAGRQQAEREARLAKALEAFSQQRATYFRRVEGEIVHLALAIARKILEREAQLDPTLLQGLVRLALDRMNAGPPVRLRLPPDQLATWQEESKWEQRCGCELVADDTLLPGECLVETNVGTAHFGFEAQLKQIEEGLFALVAHRPETR